MVYLGASLCSGCGQSVGEKEEVCPGPWEPPGMPGHSDSQKAATRDCREERSAGAGEELAPLLGKILKVP